jgi:hypothetical protein
LPARVRLFDGRLRRQLRQLDFRGAAGLVGGEARQHTVGLVAHARDLDEARLDPVEMLAGIRDCDPGVIGRRRHRGSPAIEHRIDPGLRLGKLLLLEQIRRLRRIEQHRDI